MAMVPLSEEEGPGPSRFRQALVPFFCFFFLFPWAKKTGPKTKKKRVHNKNECPTHAIEDVQSIAVPKTFRRKAPPPAGWGFPLSLRPLRAFSAPVRPRGGRDGEEDQAGRSPFAALGVATRDADMRFGVDAMRSPVRRRGGGRARRRGGRHLGRPRGSPSSRLGGFSLISVRGGGGFDTRGDSGAGNPAPGPRPRLHHR